MSPLRPTRRRARRRALLGALVALPLCSAFLLPAADELVVFASNDLGMHCMNEDFSELVILPPFNTLRAQVLKRGHGPDILTEHVTVHYSIPSNTESSSKTNFWTHAEALFGVALPPDVGLTGNGLSGTMAATPESWYEASGIPVTPVSDAGRLDAYPLARVRVVHDDGFQAETVAVVPVSTEISCNLCHDTPGISTAEDILTKHDQAHGTNLMDARPVLCASCHADPALGTTGQPGVSNLSSAMHGFHAPHVDQLGLDNSCYACHPGLRTQCQRDVHLARGIQCADCHGGMAQVGDPARTPWVDEPRCGDCHSRPGFEFEQPGRLFKDSVGHGGVMCSACHGSPHAITPTLTPADNLQAISKQGRAGVIDDCLVCHTSMPDEPFFHSEED